MRASLLFVCAIPCLFGNTFAQQPTDVELLDAGPLEYVTPGTYAVIPTIRNNNIDYFIDQVHANWQLDGGDIHSGTINAFFLGGPYLYPTFKSRITLVDSISFVEPGIHALKIWTDMPGGYPDPDPSNDTVQLTIHVCDSLPEKNILMWYGTHVDCIPCGGYGEDMIDSISVRHPDDAFLIRVHDEAGDPYVCDESTEINDIYIWPYSGHPSFVFDQFAFPCLFGMVPFELFDQQWTVVDWRKDYRFPVDAVIRDAWIDTIAMQLHAKVDARFYADHSGPLNLNLVITEDSLYGYQAGYPGGNMWHTHMMRRMLGGIDGIGDIIPEDGIAGDVYTWDIDEPLDSNWNTGQLWLTAYVLKKDNDPLQREIYNSNRMRVLAYEEPVTDTTGQVSILTDQSVFDLRIYPNPVSNGGTLYLQWNGNISPSTAEIISLDGRTVYTQEIYSSINYTTLQLPSLAEGMYHIILRNTHTIFTATCVIE